MTHDEQALSEMSRLLKSVSCVAAILDLHLHRKIDAWKDGCAQMSTVVIRR